MARRFVGHYVLQELIKPTLVIGATGTFVFQYAPRLLKTDYPCNDIRQWQRNMNEHPMLGYVCKNYQPQTFWNGLFHHFSKRETGELCLVSARALWILRVRPAV